MVVVTLDEVLPLALLARLAFIASRNQTVLSKTWWNHAFVIILALSYSLYPLPVIVGPTTLVSLAVSLLCIWKLASLAVRYPPRHYQWHVECYLPYLTRAKLRLRCSWPYCKYRSWYVATYWC